MKRALFFSLCCILISCNKYRNACNIKPYKALTQSVKQWFPYSGNRELIFKDSILRPDTLFLKDFFLGDDEVWNGDECPFSKGQFLRGNIIDLKSDDTIQTEIYNAEFVSVKRKNVELFYYDSENLLSGTGNLTFDTILDLNGVTYNNILGASCSAATNCNPNGVTKYYFAKAKGLIAYERNNILWTLRE
jgi:hypothetical protein